MDNKALYKLSYGVFVLTTKTGTEENGCIINTCMQVANSPTRVAISILNTNYTCDLLKKSDAFALSILDETTTFETIKYWGFQSGREVNKMESLPLPTDVNGMPYLSWQTSAVISCKITESYDLGSHRMFIGEVVDAQMISGKNPLTYADYQTNVKPKPQAVKDDKKIVGWRCKICNYVYEGSTLPEDYICPLCGHPKDDFEPVYES